MVPFFLIYYCVVLLFGGVARAQQVFCCAAFLKDCQHISYTGPVSEKAFISMRNNLLAFLFLRCILLSQGADVSIEAALATVSYLSQSGQMLHQLTSTNISRFLIDRPRYFTAVMLFVAENPEFECPSCNLTVLQLNHTANSYYQQYDLSEASKEETLFFFVIKYDTSKEIFEALGVNFVPRLYVIGPKEISSPKLPFANFEVRLDRLTRESDFSSAIYSKANVKVLSIALYFNAPF